MKVDKSGIEKINKVCNAASKLQDTDFEEVEKMCEEQEHYSHPFKQATAQRQHALGDHNKKVLAALKNLRDVIKEGEKI